jgi:hypothetical protein
METIKIETTADLTETTDTTLPNLEECPRLNGRKPLPLKRPQLPKIVPPIVGGLLSLAAAAVPSLATATIPIDYLEPPVLTLGASSIVAATSCYVQRRKILSLNKAWAQSGRVGIRATERRQQQRQLEAQEFLTSIDDD